MSPKLKEALARMKERQGLVEPGNILNLFNRPVLLNPEGPPSTTHSMSFEEDGREVLVPQVIQGERYSEKRAKQEYRRTGQHLGKFRTPAEATRYAQALHETQEAMGNFYNPQKPPTRLEKALAGLKYWK